MAADPAGQPYVDTSALAKRYLNEPHSDALDAYLCTFPWVAISTLTQVEIHCLLARRRRYGELDEEQESRVRLAVEEDVGLGMLKVLRVEDRHLRRSLRLLDSLDRHALRTLDALHLAIAEVEGHQVLAAADVKMAEAAEAMGLEVVTFY